MSKQLINEYHAELDRLRAVTGSTRETNLRPAFARLLRAWGRQAHDLVYTEEYQIRTKMGNLISVDGALLYALRVPFGYWEAKDEKDNLDAEIEAKRRKGYPTNNIIFSDNVTAVLWQDGREVLRVAMADSDTLDGLVTRFFAHERQELADFKKAVKQFAADLPAILEALRSRIAEKHASSRDFSNALTAFLKHAQDAINPAVSDDDVREMLIQHILTEDIFAKVFNDPEYHRKNNIAAELYKLEDALFGRGEKTALLKVLDTYYAGIASTAALISNHSEKQGFLKALYEDFYKAYNPKAADKLGVVYTPGEIVRFMIRSADWLCEKHFGKNLIDRGVEILDPATGTGTFIVELLESFRGQGDKLRHKYKEELHANEIAILPYYVANLNIEATYQAITGQFAEFENLCLVDTLDNVAALGIYSGHQFDMFGSITDENVERIKRQNRRKISVIIGNPPYNAWQESYNENNANRPYARVDARVKQTYVSEGAAQNKSSVYDMYTRFVRWASDRISDDGLIAFVIGRKPISKAAYDGFRKVVEREFSEIWLVDLGGDVRENPKLSGTTHNVFGIQTGVMIALMVKRRGKGGAKIRYVRRPEMETAEDKLAWLSHEQSIGAIKTDFLTPDKKHDWLYQTNDGWATFLALVDISSKNDARSTSTRAIFKLVSSGVQTKQDDWAYGDDYKSVSDKMNFLITDYGKALKSGQKSDANIKWHRELDRRLLSKTQIIFEEDKVKLALYRPFSKQHLYFDRLTNSQSFRMHDIFQNDENPSITFLGKASANLLAVFGSNIVFDTCLLKNGNGSTQCVPRYRYIKSGERVDNITDWALNKFVARYGKKPLPFRGGDGGGGSPQTQRLPESPHPNPSPEGEGHKEGNLSPEGERHNEGNPSPEGKGLKVSKDAIFAYCYGVLHDPVYRETYALNLKREFPRIPFYPDFAQWAAWGEALMAMHIGYETVEPWPVERIETPGKRAEGTHPKPVLKSHPDKGCVVVDADTQITGIPAEAWSYRLGNRSAIDWVLDQHKEKKPKDPTIAAKFNTYRFADYKERMIELLARVVRVSVDTVAITEAMKALDRSGWDAG